MPEINPTNGLIRRYRRLPSSRRDGYVLVLVLLSISMVVALSYVMLRSAQTLGSVQVNLVSRDAARAAAEQGLPHAIARMSQTAWKGPASNYQQALSEQHGFRVVYAYGDALSVSDADYWQEPYRVRVAVEGYFKLHDSSSREIKYLITASLMLDQVQLNPARATFAANLPPRTVTAVDRSFLGSLNPSSVGFWSRIEGTTHGIKGIRVWPTVNEDRRTEFLTAVKSLPWSFAAPYIDRADVESTDVLASHAAAMSVLELPLFQVPAVPEYGDYPSVSTEYQLYRGGPRYSIPALAGLIEKTDLLANTSNPLGIFRGTENLTVDKQVKLTGTLVMDAGYSATLQDKQIEFASIEHRLPDGSIFQLPVVLSDFLTTTPRQLIRIDGTIVVKNALTNVPLDNRSMCRINGKVICDHLALLPFNGFFNTTDFRRPSDFQDFVKSCNLPGDLHCIIKDAPPINLHWQDFSQPLIVPLSGSLDPYRWQIITRKDQGWQ